MYQTCPICQGSGKKQNQYTSTNVPVCDVCLGRKIIHQTTGLPPELTFDMAPKGSESKTVVDEIKHTKECDCFFCTGYKNKPEHHHGTCGCVLCVAIRSLPKCDYEMSLEFKNPPGVVDGHYNNQIGEIDKDSEEYKRILKIANDVNPHNKTSSHDPNTCPLCVSSFKNIDGK